MCGLQGGAASGTSGFGVPCCSTASPRPHQRPYDIHSSNAVESLVQLFSTVSVQYVPTWSKEMVALLRKVSAPQPRSEEGFGFLRVHIGVAPTRLTAGRGPCHLEVAGRV